MNTIGPYLFIHTGLIIRLLRHCTSFQIGSIVSESGTLVKNLELMDFKVSSAAVVNLKGFITTLSKDPNQNRAVTKSEADELEEIMARVEHTVFAEAETKQVYVITESRFNLQALLSSPAKMFDDSTFVRLGNVARQDITSAFQCLGFDQPTASAFLMLRATESVLKDYYFVNVRRKRLDAPMWGNMVEQLGKLRKRDEKLLARLKYIKDSYRNPTAHPDAVYSIHESQDLIGICIEVINRMAKMLPEPPREIADDPFA